MHHIKRRRSQGICEIGNIEYDTLQGAITSIPENGSGVIHVYEDLSDLPELVLNAGSKVTICCSKHYALSFTANIVELGNNQELHLHEMANLSGGNMEINGTSAVLALEGCQYVTGRIISTSGAGSVVFIYLSSFQGIADHPAINIDNADTLHVIGYSRIKGATGQAAVIYSLTADDKLKAKFSTFIHGNGNGTLPIDRVEAGITNDVSIYSCAGNADLAPSAQGFTNLVTGANNTIDTAVSF